MCIKNYLMTSKCLSWHQTLHHDVKDKPQLHIPPDKSSYLRYFLVLWLHCPGKAPMELPVLCSVDPETPRILHDSTRLNYESAQNAPRMRTLKFESCLNVPRLRPDLTDGPTKSPCLMTLQTTPWGQSNVMTLKNNLWLQNVMISKIRHDVKVTSGR